MSFLERERERNFLKVLILTWQHFKNAAIMAQGAE